MNTIHPAFTVSLLTLALVCSGCTGSDTPEGFNACPAQRSQICTREYNPVCAVQEDGERSTRATGCTACSDPLVTGWVAGPCD